MKTFFKNNLIWIFALVLSIGTMSFKLAEKSNNALSETWYYMPDTTGSEKDHESYTRDPEGFNCTGGGPVWCTISAPEDGNTGYPDLSNVETPTSYKL